MSKAFISYAHADRLIVDRICRDIRRHGVDLWRDVDNLPVGDQLAIALARAIEACEYFIVILSPSACTSTWVAQEISMGLHYAIEGGKRILPVVIEECEPHPSLKDRVFADLRTNYAEGLQALLRTIGIGDRINKPLTHSIRSFAQQSFSIPLPAIDSWVAAIATRKGFLASVIVNGERADENNFFWFDAELFEVKKHATVKIPATGTSNEFLIETSQGRILSFVMDFDLPKSTWFLADLTDNSPFYFKIGRAEMQEKNDLPFNFLNSEEIIISSYFIGQKSSMAGKNNISVELIGHGKDLDLVIQQNSANERASSVMLVNNQNTLKQSVAFDERRALVAWFSPGNTGIFSDKYALRCMLVDIEAGRPLWSEDCVLSTHPSIACPIPIFRILSGWGLVFTEDYEDSTLVHFVSIDDEEIE